ncbi:MAG: nitroreductase family protein, partial [Alistipes sp.]|nr:nitroreductase family protein [Alistipes sp.]
MEFKEVVNRRRSTRRYTGKPVEREKLQRAMELALKAPSSKNTRSTRLMAVTNLDKVHALGRVRDWGSSLLEEAAAAIVVLGDESASPMWQTNASISATLLQLALVDEGLASCWVHVGD